MSFYAVAEVSNSLSRNKIYLEITTFQYRLKKKQINLVHKLWYLRTETFRCNISFWQFHISSIQKLYFFLQVFQKKHFNFILEWKDKKKVPPCTPVHWTNQLKMNFENVIDMLFFVDFFVENNKNYYFSFLKESWCKYFKIQQNPK